MSALRKELNDATTQFRKFNQDVLNAATKLKPLEQAADSASKKLTIMGAVSKGLSFALGILGVQSVAAVTMRLISFVKESVNAGIALNALQNRAKAVYGDAFPSVQRAAQAMATELKRSSSDILSAATSFALLLDSVGLSTEKINSYSLELTRLATVIGKARPDLSDIDIYNRLEQGILGSVKGLRELGIVMTKKALQDLADRKNIKLKIDEMTDEQATVLRSMFLIEETTKLQEAAALSTDSLGDAAKTAKANWQDLKEVAGEGLGPAFVGAISIAIQLATNLVNTLVAGAEMIRSIGLGLRGMTSQEINALSDAKSLDIQNQAALNAAVNRRRISGTGALPTATESESDFWKRQTPAKGGGGGENPREKEEKKIAEALKEQASLGKELLTARREELQLKQKLGILTTKEESQLKAINSRVEFQKDAIEDATEAWEDQVKALEDVEEKIKDINQRIIDEKKDLEETLTDIDKDASKSKSEKVSDLVKELKEIETKLRNGEGSPVELENRKREIDNMLDPFRQSDEGRAMLHEGERLSGLNEFQLIDDDAEKRKKEVQEESDLRLKAYSEELIAVEDTKQKLLTAEAEKKQAVMDALTERIEHTQAAYVTLETMTSQHVANMKALYDQLNAAASSGSKAPVKRAMGGPIFGAGGPTDDKIHAMLSNGEFVVNAMATKLYRPLIEQINNMSLPVPRFATGGAVTNNSESRNFNIQQTFNRSEMSNPLLHAWHMRRLALR